MILARTILQNVNIADVRDKTEDDMFVYGTYQSMAEKMGNKIFKYRTMFWLGIYTVGVIFMSNIPKLE